ncbi:MAG: HAD-IC family P-type ATPase [Eubacterium sp.]|nr:HAD-IC family P-type ATPase [Eubacterium sp.]
MNHTTRTKRQIILSHTVTYFNFLNLILAGLVVISGQYKNMLFLGVVIANSLIGIIQELRVKKLIDALSVITATKVKIVRGNSVEIVPTEQLLEGDIIEISTGDQLVADCIVTDSSGLELNESLLTGESVPVLKKTGDSLLSGTFVTAGTGRGKVTHVGSNNYASQLVAKARTKKRATSEMQNSIKKIIKYVSIAIIPIGLLLFYSQYHQAGTSLSNSLVKTVAGVLGMIPEGLVLLTSVSFILGVGRLARKKALVQEMEAIEALARVNVLCLDKTGTITTGKLAVDSILPLSHYADSTIETIMNGLVFAFSETNATTEALQEYFHDTKPYRITDSIPFSSRRKFMGVTFADAGSFVLGAPDFLCQDLTIIKTAERYEKKGYRVLLLASCDALANSGEELTGVIPYALFLLSDEIKEDAPEIFRFFASQGVDIKIISGDSAATVSAVGVRAGVKGAERYIDATTLPTDFDALCKTVKNYTIFGRVSPEQKQQLILAYQHNGKVVGMVGDGVNDVLALKDSDCGIAMANGSDAARQTAHIVLLDSDFSSMKNIVKEGRTVIANIERVSALYLTKTIYSILLCVLFIILGKSYPFIPIQLSLIGATAIGLPSFLLTLEKNDKVTTGGFFRHVLRISLPAALILTAILLCIQFLAHPFGLSSMMVSTLNLLTGGIVSLGVVAVVCRPFTKKRAALCIGITALFFGAILLMPGFFRAMPLWELM